MKKIITTALMMSALFLACNNSSNQQANDCGMEKDCCKGVYSPKSVLDSAEFLVDKQLKIKANVTRVCHCGSNITFTDLNDTTVTLYVRAGGEIPKFNQCLKGKSANISGYLRVKKYTQADLDSTVMMLENKLSEFASKSDSASLKMVENIKAKIADTKADNAEKGAWMAAHNSDFYPFYYFEAEKFAPCCVKKNDPEAADSNSDCKNHENSNCR